jgi:hypothetical protein
MCSEMVSNFTNNFTSAPQHNVHGSYSDMEKAFRRCFYRVTAAHRAIGFVPSAASPPLVGDDKPWAVCLEEP